MGWVVGLSWVSHTKQHCRTLFLRMRAKMKKAVKNRGSKQRITFHYDPSSYALNFDDGRCEFSEGTDAFDLIPARSLPSNHNSTWVFVQWVKPLQHHPSRENAVLD